MSLTKRPKWKKIWITLLAVMGLLIAVGGSYAAYISQDAQRGVARNRDTDTIRFTSNFLQPTSSANDNEFAGKIVSYNKKSISEDKLEIDIYVYNYVQGSTGLVNEKDITYDMSIRLTGGTRDQYTVKFENDVLSKTGDSYNKTGAVLTGRAQNSHHYTVEIPGADLDKVKIIAKATPVNMSYTGNKFLAATIAPCTSSEVKEFSCEGIFTDQGNGSPQDYAAFNYEVTISGGKASVALNWNPALVEIDPFFLEKLGKNNYTLSDENTEKKLIFTMDQNAGTGEYLIPFYRKSKDTSLPSQWDDMKSVIHVSGDQVISTD